MRRFEFCHPDEILDPEIRRISIAIRADEAWLFMRDESGENWDLLEGNRGLDESPANCANRILLEHFSVDFEVKEVCPYRLNVSGRIEFGMLFFAKSNGMVVSSSAKYGLFSKLPDHLSRQEVSRRLFMGVQGWLNMQTNADELWDVYDKNRNKTGRLHRRGDFLKKGDYHLVVHVWLLNSKGQFLLTKRAPNKGFPNTWETSGGAAQAGDDSLSAAIREVREETGLIAKPDNASLYATFKREDDFCDVWVIRQDFDLKNVVLLKGETVDKMYADKETLLQMYRNKELVPYLYLIDFLNKFC